MGTSYDRRINLYINGQQVSNDVKSIRAEIDIGMDIHQIEESPIPNMTGQIILSLPGMPCMNCFGFLTETNLAKETAKYGKAGGRPQVVWSNGILASQAVGTFVDIITGWTGNNNKLVYLAYDGNLGTLIDHPRLKFVSKPCPHFPYSGVGPAKFKSI
jgi:hypothetical protein